MSTFDRIAATALALFAVILFGAVIFPLLPETALTFRIATGALFVACVAHCAGQFGLRTTGGFIAISSIVGWVSEELGVTSGIVFPRYHYGDQLGAMLGSVPVIVPPSWMIFTYCAYMMAKMSVGGKRPFVRMALRVLFGALTMACLDLALEPLAILRRYWFWDSGRSFPATQLLLFFGWLFWGAVSQAAFCWWIAITPNDARSEPAGRRTDLLPLLVAAGVALYSTWITTRDWSVVFFLLAISSLGPVFAVSLGSWWIRNRRARLEA